MAQAVDYSWGRVGGTIHTHLAAVEAAGYEGVLRYLSHEQSKDMSSGEYLGCRERGLSVGLVWETTANMMQRGYNGGVSDALEANRQADELGFPAMRPLYYACDYDAYDYNTLIAYMNGAKSVSKRPCGIYGKYEVIERIVGTGVSDYGWQCAAWSGNGTGTGGSIQGRRVSVHSCLYQKVGYVLSNTCDENEILDADWGQDRSYTDTLPDVVVPTYPNFENHPALKGDKMPYPFTLDGQAKNEEGEFYDTPENEGVLYYIEDSRAQLIRNVPHLNFLFKTGVIEPHPMQGVLDEDGNPAPNYAVIKDPDEIHVVKVAYGI